MSLQFGPPAGGWPDFSKPKKPRCYLAGAIRSDPARYRRRFQDGKDILEGMGWDVVSPIDIMDRMHQTPGVDADDRAGLAADINELVKCDAVMLLSSWEYSSGAKAEVAVANALDIPSYLVGRWPRPTSVAGPRLPATPRWNESFESFPAKYLDPVHSSDLLDTEFPEYGQTPPPHQLESICQEAHRLVHGDRQGAYGHPADDFARTGRIWGAILGIPDVDPALVGLCLAGVKISREVNAPKRDNRVDLAGYAETVDLVRQRQAKGA